MVTRNLLQMSEESVRRMAYILGESSAAHMALMDYEARKAVGQSPAFYLDRKDSALLVGPAPPSPEEP